MKKCNNSGIIKKLIFSSSNKTILNSKRIGLFRNGVGNNNINTTSFATFQLINKFIIEKRNFNSSLLLYTNNIINQQSNNNNHYSNKAFDQTKKENNNYHQQQQYFKNNKREIPWSTIKSLSLSLISLLGLTVSLSIYLINSSNFNEFIIEAEEQSINKKEEEEINQTLKEDEKKEENLPIYSLEEISKHNSLNNQVWVIFKGYVYNVTDFIASHPGGVEKIMLAAGKSIEPFWNIYQQHHTKEVYEILSEYKIGKLNQEEKEFLEKKHNKDKDNTNGLYANEPQRSPILNVNMAKPFNAETPPALLVDSFVTPNELFFVRNHLPVPKIDKDTYILTIEGEGLKDGPIQLTLDELKNISEYPKETLQVTLQCAGNRRTEYDSYKQTRGLGWTNAAIGNAEWSGIKLINLLKHYNISVDNLEQVIKHVHFEGMDTDGISTYAISIPADRALNDKADVLIAYEMNGKEIPIDHGYPVRAIVPGAIGARNVKWLSKIIFSKEECQSVWQQRDYKTFNPSTDWENVDFCKARAVHDSPIQSSICSPSHEGTIRKDEDIITIKGYAHSGGGKSIERVDITMDNGNTWLEAELQSERKEALYNRNYSWSLFKLDIPITDDMRGKDLTLCSKAMDSSYNVQPEGVKGIWNMRGILNNSWHCIKLNIENKEEEEEENT
ncbi:hypothetical protein ABK040_004988 [Willaertia magna]